MKWVAQSCQACDGWSHCAKGVAAGWYLKIGDSQGIEVMSARSPTVREGGCGLEGGKTEQTMRHWDGGEVSADTRDAEHSTYG